MTWLWDPSISLDVAFYIVMMATSPQPVVWQEVHTTPGLFYEENSAPVVGECIYYDIQAEDWASNRSVR